MKEIIINKNDLITNTNSLIDKTIPLVSNLANLSKLLIDSFPNTSWAGFYLSNENFSTLFLGPFQGNLACTIIPFNKGVCGKAAFNKKTIIVDNVHEFEGHIACSSLTNSEIVVPIIKNNNVVGVIDLDSNNFANYSNTDKELLEEMAKIISELF